MIFALLVIAHIFLSIITRHGKEVPVPDFQSMTMEEAEELASENSLRLDVRDSVCANEVPHGTIYSQNPAAGEMVKKGRRVLIVLNSLSVKKVSVPSLVGLSLRGAETEIVSRGFRVGTLEYVPDMATDYVLEQKVGTRNVVPGEKLPLGTKINLVIGVNSGDTYTYMPRIYGMTLEAASEELNSNSLNLGEVIFDESVASESDKQAAVVYSYTPSTVGGAFPRGTEVSLILTIDSTKISQIVPAL